MLDTSLDSRVRRTMLLSLFEGGLIQTFLNWTTGSVLIGYMLHYGANPTEIGLIASVPLLAQSSGPLAAWLAGFAGRVKPLIISLGLFGRILWVFGVFLPQLPISEHLRVPFLIGLVAISSFFQSSGGTLWAHWLGQVIPTERRGRYFGFRTGVVGIVGMATNLLAGWFLDRVAAPLNFQVVLGVGMLCAFVGTSLLIWHYEPRLEQNKHSFKDIVTLPFKDTNFRKFLIFATYWQAAVLISAPFLIPYFLEHLKMSFTQIAIWSAIAAVTAMFTTTFWGRMADRMGNKAILQIATFIAGSVMVISWIIATPSNLWPIWFAAMVDAVVWGAIGPAMFNLALGSAPKADRLPYIASFSMLTGIAGFLGGVIAGLIFPLLAFTDHMFGGYHWTAYQSIFVLSALFRMQAWWLVRPVAETNAWRARDVLRQVRSGWRGMGFPWRS